MDGARCEEGIVMISFRVGLIGKEDGPRLTKFSARKLAGILWDAIGWLASIRGGECHPVVQPTGRAQVSPGINAFTSTLQELLAEQILAVLTIEKYISDAKTDSAVRTRLAWSSLLGIREDRQRQSRGSHDCRHDWRR
ncbi:hypothetical protein [Novosphingobium lindaniclasticum]|nr:hypothetical protein [Novosphingobium lindaniclasticum]